jgi:hypothetical protein
VSVDGFLAPPAGTVDFLEAGGGEASMASEEFNRRTVDVLLMGEQTYEGRRAVADRPSGTKPVLSVLSTRALPADAGVRAASRRSARTALPSLEARGSQERLLSTGDTRSKGFLRAA